MNGVEGFAQSLAAAHFPRRPVISFPLMDLPPRSTPYPQPFPRPPGITR